MPLSGKGLVEDGGAGGLKPSATLRVSVADPAAFFTRRAPVAPPSAAARRGARHHHRRPAGSPGGGWRPGAARRGRLRRTGAACRARTHARPRTRGNSHRPWGGLLWSPRRAHMGSACAHRPLNSHAALRGLKRASLRTSRPFCEAPQEAHSDLRTAPTAALALAAASWRGASTDTTLFHSLWRTRRHP